MPQARTFIKKETPTQVFSCEISEIFKNTYFEEHLRTTTSDCELNRNSSEIYLFELNNKDVTTYVEIILVPFIVDFFYVSNKLVISCLPRLKAFKISS